MKKGIIAFGFILAFLATSAQTDTTEINVEVEAKNGDSSVFKWGNSKVIVISSDKEDKDNDKKNSKDRWNHFAGIDLGINGFLSPSNSVDLQKEGEFMDLNYAKSISVAINFMEYYIPLWQEKIGFSTGLGFEFNSYDLDRDYTVFSDKDSTFGITDGTKNLEKNKFKSTMLNLPLMLETNIGRTAKNSFHLAIGGMASYRVGSKTKQIFSRNGEDYKVKNRTDFNMNPFRFSAVARIGYGDFTVFAAYSLTPIFEKDKGPELYPFTVGISLVSF